MTAAPIFSIIIAAYNREALIQRAVSSCLVQRHPSFEVIVVDDGSTDRTAARARECADGRLRVYVQPVNRGVSAARNLAVAHARGEWIVCLDSDDELTTNALELVQEELDRVPPDVDALRFMCLLDDGTCSPVPPLAREIWGYEAYLRWAERVARGGQQETLTCIRRRTFEVVRYPDGGGEAGYHMDLAARFRTATSPAVARLYHSDAADQISRPNVARALAQAPHHARNFQLLLDCHGAALRRWAPELFALYTRALATHQFLSAQRWAGVTTIGRLALARHASWGAWAILVCGLLGPRVLARAQAERRRSLTGPVNALPRGVDARV